ncbi:HK97 family phage prohead protease [Rhizobium sp. CNPSo 4039]|uniref:HK97 family phage prohead protease n=1 Tax=Rhizobium sp. CNPSo 4039 TaxID=3021409 RepID=UPI00254F8A44|nr:HK97 family phage prohead protease [Rhizobium sp. CNPSo 4039]MDK4712999.1 HK97 family phage prohead protease [Rhizobium sp. CNPSo 4039]
MPKLQRDAEVRAGSFDQSTNTIDVIFTTGATVRRMSWLDGEFDEELVVGASNVRLDRLNAGAPFLDTHGQWSLGDVIGSVVRGSANVKGGVGYAKILLSNAPDAADRVARIKEGTVSNISVGYRIHAVETTEREGQTPLRRVVDWEPWEISAVPIPADPGAQVRADQSDASFSCRIESSVSALNTVRRLRMQMALRHMELAR